MKKTLIAIASILAIVAGCAKTNENKVADGKIRATIEEAGTKATLNYGGKVSDNFLTWEAGDKILLMNAGSRVEATLTSGEGTIYGSFDAESVPTGTYYAVYPAVDENYFVSVEGDDSLFVFYPSELTYNAKTGNIENGGNVMIAQQEGAAIKFKNVCSYVRFTITGEETQKVSKVVLEARGDGYLAGQLYIKDLESDEFYYENTDLASKTVDITFPDGEALSETGLSFNVALAPKCEYGFKATVYLTDGSYQELTSGEWWGRNQVIVMPAFAFSGKDVAQVDGVNYKNMASAIAAANAAEAPVTIQMIADAIANGDTLKNTNCVTLDLNGHTINGNIVVDSLASFKLIDGLGGGYIKNEKNALKILACATFVMDGGTIESSATASTPSNSPLSIVAGSAESIDKTNIFLNAGKVIGKTNYGSVYAARATVVIEDGFEVEGDRCLFPNTSAVFTVNGGKFTGRHCIHYGSKSSSITINGGEFAATDAIASFSVASGNHVVLGGYFDAPVAAYGQYIANASIKAGYYTFKPDNVLSGYEAQELSTPIVYKGKTYTHTIAVSTKIVARLTIGGDSEDFTTIEAALAKAKQKGGTSTLTLQDSVSMADLVELDGAIDLTLDLNGFTLDVNANKINLTNASANLTIMNSGSTGEYRMALTNDTYGMIVSKGTLTIESGFIRNNGGVAMFDVATGATAIVNGGRIESLNASGKGFRNKGTVTINGGTIVTGLYSIWAQAGTTNIHGGELISNLGHVLYCSAGAATVNIDGGSLVAKTDGKYPVCTTTDKIKHVVTITKTATTEPVLYNTNNTEGRDFERALFNGYSYAKTYVYAGYFGSLYLGKSTTPDSYLASGYKRETLGTPVKKVIDGVEYQFKMRVVPNEE